MWNCLQKSQTAGKFMQLRVLASNRGPALSIATKTAWQCSYCLYRTFYNGSYARAGWNEWAWKKLKNAEMEKDLLKKAMTIISRSSKWDINPSKITATHFRWWKCARLSKHVLTTCPSVLLDQSSMLFYSLSESVGISSIGKCTGEYLLVSYIEENRGQGKAGERLFRLLAEKPIHRKKTATDLLALERKKPENRICF